MVARVAGQAGDKYLWLSMLLRVLVYFVYERYVHYTSVVQNVPYRIPSPRTKIQ